MGVWTAASDETNALSAAVARAASRSLASTGSGVPAGANSADHWKNTVGTPLSVRVGTSGSDARRLSPQDARTRTLAALTCWMTVDGPVESASTLPLSSPTTAGPPPV